MPLIHLLVLMLVALLSYQLLFMNLKESLLFVNIQLMEVIGMKLQYQVLVLSILVVNLG